MTVECVQCNSTIWHIQHQRQILHSDLLQRPCGIGPCTFILWGLKVFIFFAIVCPITHTKWKLLGGGSLLVSRFSIQLTNSAKWSLGCSYSNSWWHAVKNDSRQQTKSTTVETQALATCSYKLIKTQRSSCMCTVWSHCSTN